jgi:hypothetical protein
MNNFYELLPDKFHLNEYHEYFFFKKINGLKDDQIRRLQEYEHFDIRLFPFEGSGGIKRDAESEKYYLKYPDCLYFSGDFHESKLERADYPITDAYQLPVISKKLLTVIDSVKPFKRDIVPAVIYDFLEKAPFNENNELRNDIKQTSDYVYLKLFQFVTIDKVKTKIEKDSKFFWNFNIEMPDEGLDPIFRIRQLPERIFITEDVFHAIDEYNIKKENKKIEGIKLYDGGNYYKSIDNVLKPF